MPYQIEDIDTLGYPHVIRMSFELPYSDWREFEQSKSYQNLIEYLKESEQKKKVKPTKFQIGLLALNLVAITMSIISLVKK